MRELTMKDVKCKLQILQIMFISYYTICNAKLHFGL